MSTPEMLEQLQSLATAEEVESFIDEQEFKWRPLGGRENNVGTVRSGSDPSQALAERITNGIDAVLERAIHNGSISGDPETPREAVEELLDLSKEGFAAMSDTQIREIAEENIQVSMCEGGDKKRPTIEVEDAGIGQRPDQFPDTFLGLNEDNKITKPYLIGKYGQGGSNTFDFCEYAVILSRHVDGGDLGWSIVRFNPRLDEDETYSDGVFEYCVRPDGSIPRIAKEHVTDWVGSTVRLIEYDAADFSNILGPGRKSLYTVAHKLMFGSLFPFRLVDTRSDRFSFEESKSRTVLGSRYRLDTPAKDVYETRKFKRVDLGKYGTLKVKYWVLEDIDSVPQFVDKTEPVVFTLHGQKHHTEPKRFLRDTEHTFLKDRLIVEVECDQLSQAGKRVFSSTRDRASEGVVYRVIMDQFSEVLKNDDKLERLNQEFKERALGESSSEQEEKAKNLLAELLQQPDDADGGGVRADGGPGGDDGPGRGRGGSGSRDPVEPRHEYPTFVEIDNVPDPIPAKRGRTMRVRVKVDAEDDFEALDRGQFDLDWGDSLDDALTYRSETALDEGWKIFQVEVDDDATVGTDDDLRVTVTWPSERLADERPVEIVEQTERTGRGGDGHASLAAPEIKQVTEDDEERRTIAGLTQDDSVVEYKADEDGPGQVFVAMFNENIRPIRETNDTEGTVERYDRQYAAYISYYEVMRAEDEETADPDPEYVHKEKNRTAKVLMRSISEGLDPEELGLV